MKKYNPIILVIYGSVFGVIFGRTQYFSQHLDGSPFEHGTFPGLWIGASVGLAFCILWNVELFIKYERYSHNKEACQKVMKKKSIGSTKVMGMLLRLGGSILLWLLGGYVVLPILFLIGICTGRLDSNATISIDTTTMALVKWSWFTSAAISLLFAVLRLRGDHDYLCAQAALVVAEEREAKEREARETKERERREREEFIQNTRAKLNNFFIRSGTPLSYISEVLQYIEANSINPTYKKDVLSEIRKQETRLYQDFVSVVSNNDLETASKGMQLLCAAFPEKKEYKEALDRLRDKRKLIAVMEQNGLPKSSPLITKYTNILE